MTLSARRLQVHDRKKGRLGAPTLSATIDLTHGELEGPAKEQQIPPAARRSRRRSSR
jgi:hypothetical protein